MWQGDVSLGDAFVISLTGLLVVMLELTIIALFIVLLSRVIRLFHGKKQSPQKEEIKESAPTPPPVVPDGEQTGTDSSGEITFEGISSEEAAVIMSAVSAESGTPLDRIKFKSIKKI